jgi:hypothetical protein
MDGAAVMVAFLSLAFSLSSDAAEHGHCGEFRLEAPLPLWRDSGGATSIA